jgi:hypothetical protein
MVMSPFPPTVFLSNSIEEKRMNDINVEEIVVGLA